MAEKNNATCVICGKGYHMCLSCRDSISLAPWKAHTDTSEHYKVYQIIRGYNTKKYTKEEARAKLKNVDLSDMKTFREHIRVKIEDILKEEKTFVETSVEIEPKPETEVQIEAEPKVEEIEEVVEVEKPKSTRKRYSKVETE